MVEAATVDSGADAAVPLQTFLDASPLVGGTEMTLVAGRAGSVEEVERLLAWPREREGPAWWSFREWTDAMRLTKGIGGLRREDGEGDRAGDDARFVAGRWFGEGGDLEVWRDGEGFGWRWLGPPGERPPGEVESDFFEKDEVRLRRVDGRRALLWDRRDARVATADAATMRLLPMDGRMELRYVAYYDRGVVAAVWYRGIVDVLSLAPGSNQQESDG